jgi:hypothetical protein
MPELMEKEIEMISDDIDQQGLTFTPLKNELLDHICCQIEEGMEQGMSFNEAYRKVRTDMGRKRIRQIQDETLTFISKKYRRMKRIMYVMGVAAPILLIAAAIFKAFHWPGASVLITLALFITGMVFLPIFVMVRIRDTRRQDEPVPMNLYLTGMIFGMIAILGTLFKVQHWPGAGWMMTIGLAGTALVFLPMYASYQIRSSKKEIRASTRRLWIGGTITGIFFILGALFKIMHWPGAGIVIIVSWSVVAVIFIPLLVLNQLRQSENRISNFFGILLFSVAAAVIVMALTRSVPEYYSLGYFMMEDNFLGSAEYYHEKTGDLMAMHAGEMSAEMERFTKDADELAAYILSVRGELVDFFTNEDAEPYMDHGRLDLREMSRVGKSVIPYEMIIVRDKNKLTESMYVFRDRAEKLTSDPALIDYLDTQLSFYRPEEWPEDRWIDHHFKGPLLHTITLLDSYLETVRFVEYEVLKSQNSKANRQHAEAVPLN